ncbi:MAG: O-antigen ligase family protein [Chthoniobacteraceae bacterium]|jgi:O-antigen ligase
MRHDVLRNTLDRRLAAALFAVLVLAAALLYGAVDRVVQVGLVFGLAIGFFLHPPELPQMPRVWAWLGVGLTGFVIVSQFLPAGWFGHTMWRTVLTRDYDVAIPFTRNPEPGRAVDCILMGLLAGAWFFWVRALASERPVRIFLVWALFVTASAVAAVSLALGTRTDYLIYGIRYTPGWTGFGPFPNRNHTAALLAMGALTGAGCVIRAARRRHWVELGAAIVLEVAVVVALLESKSRGGLLGLGCGAVLFAVMAISKHRSRSAVAGALAGGLLCATLVLSFGAKVLSRFEGPGDGNIPNNLRWQIWQDAIRVWRDAPLWGHGLGTFAQIFPIYQTVQAHEQMILHPESSWLLWLDELGAIPVAVGAVLLLYFFGRNAIGAVQTGDRGFFMRVGAFAGAFALLCHGLWDVPAHRWGTDAFGIALLAIACPPLHRRRQIRLGRSWAGVPIFIGLFWLLPFVWHGPLWSPETERQLLAELNYSPTFASLDVLRHLEAYFPLDPELREEIGIREMIDEGRPEQAWNEFRIADRLFPSSWALPAMQGWLSREVSPGMSFHFWSLSIERADRRAPDIFTAAYNNSVNLQGGEEFWRGYAEANPEFLLFYAECVPSLDEGKAAYEKWWKVRGDTPAEFEPWEIRAFYPALSKWGDAAQLDIWMSRHPELEAADYRTWASILHVWQMDGDAWAVLSRRVKEPAFPDSTSGEPDGIVEANWREHPDDPVAAQAYARECFVEGHPAKSEQVILTVAAGKSPPPWFIEKAAFLYAAKKDYATAVTSLLRLRETSS